MPSSTLTTKDRIDLFLYQLENSPDCERCHLRIGVVIWDEEIIVCRECWRELLDQQGHGGAERDAA